MNFEIGDCVMWENRIYNIIGKRNTVYYMLIDKYGSIFKWIYFDELTKMY